MAFTGILWQWKHANTTNIPVHQHHKHNAFKSLEAFSYFCMVSHKQLYSFLRVVAGYCHQVAMSQTALWATFTYAVIGPSANYREQQNNIQRAEVKQNIL